MGEKGQCLCGAVQIEITDPHIFDEGAFHGHLCHCSNCRAWGGTVVASILKIPKYSVKITGEEHLKHYQDSATLSGHTVDRQFCGECGCCVLKMTPRSPDSVDLSMGLFRTIPCPEMEAFCEKVQKWEKEVHWPAMKRFTLLPGGKEMKP